MYDRLQKVGLCLSHRSTIRLVDKFGEGFDRKVLQWKTEIEETMDASVSTVDVVNNYYTLLILVESRAVLGGL